MTWRASRSWRRASSISPGSLLDCQGTELDGYIWWRLLGAGGREGWAATKWLDAARAQP